MRRVVVVGPAGVPADGVLRRQIREDLTEGLRYRGSTLAASTIHEPSRDDPAPAPDDRDGGRSSGGVLSSGSAPA
ncbi:MAG: hypothetical protein BGP03_30830 [Pseudonocardia sp. 73-21]|nr:MAG: hypothetical protein BGP03_30830 [Pseudonocardia sp. 73-21]